MTNLPYSTTPESLKGKWNLVVCERQQNGPISKENVASFSFESINNTIVFRQKEGDTKLLMEICLERNNQVVCLYGRLGKLQYGGAQFGGEYKELTPGCYHFIANIPENKNDVINMFKGQFNKGFEITNENRWYEFIRV